MIEQFIRIKLESKCIDQANSVKYLGILVNSTLTWKPHVTELSKKLARTSGIFFKIRHYVSHETLRLLYYSLFYSFISYGISVWGLTHPTVLDPLCKIQKKVVRAITFNNKYTHTNPLFYNLCLLKIYEIHSLKFSQNCHTIRTKELICMRVCVFSNYNPVLLQFYAQFNSNSVQIYHCKNHMISLYFYHSIKFQLRNLCKG